MKWGTYLAGATAIMLTVGAGTAFAQSKPATESASAQKRNVIFVLLDDLRFDGMGFLQSKIKTPNIDALAAQGAYFPNAIVTSSLCSPSRATILTGQTARNHRIVDNNGSSEEGLTFFPSYMQQQGYQTAFIGKWHMGTDVDSPRPGFNEWVSFKGQGYYNPTDGVSPDALKSGARQMLNVNGKPVQQKSYITDELTDYATNWLEHGRDPSKPFFLYLSHKAVHSDPVPPERYKDQYANTNFDLPTTMADTPENREGKPMWVQNQRNSWHGIDFFYAQDKKMNDYLKDYYATLSGVDDSVGKLVKYLKDNKLEEKTMIVFYSDNGFMVGDHGLIDKRNAYEASLRVPMVVWAPGLVQPGTVNPAVVRNLDLAPTFVDLAGGEKPKQFEGVSLMPLISGKTKPADWKAPDFVYEYYWEWTFPMTPTTFAIERDRVKYIQYHGVWDIEEIYDLNKDPDELHNLIDDPAYFDRKVELRKALYRQLADRNGLHNIPYGGRTSQGISQRSKAGAAAAPFPSKWLVEANRPGRLNDVFGDTPAKMEAEKAGKPYFPKR